MTNPADPSDQITAFGIQRRAADWARLPVCVVDEAELRRRIRDGVKAEVALTSRRIETEDRRISQVPFTERDAALCRPDPPKNHGRGTKKLSRYIGVSKRQGGWYAQIKPPGARKPVYLGAAPDEISAAVLYDQAARKHGRRLNFPGGKP